MTKHDVIIIVLSVLSVSILIAVWAYETRRYKKTKEYLNYSAVRKSGQNINNIKAKEKI